MSGMIIRLKKILIMNLKLIIFFVVSYYKIIRQLKKPRRL